jgi:hypothetical protein
VDGREKSEVNLWPVAEFERESHSVVAWDSDRACKNVRSDLKQFGERTTVALLSHPLSTGYLVPVCIAEWFR